MAMLAAGLVAETAALSPKTFMCWSTAGYLNTTSGQQMATAA